MFFKVFVAALVGFKSLKDNLKPNISVGGLGCKSVEGDLEPNIFRGAAPPPHPALPINDGL